jgi:type III secretion protein V
VIRIAEGIDISMLSFMPQKSSGAKVIFNYNWLAGKHSDLAVIAAVTAIIALMVFPVSAAVLDALIAFNIVVGVLLILSAIYISAPTDFTVFPSLLLITTLYRLSLSIATTRMILTKAHAGRIIDVFGNLAAGGNLVVGLVVFLIITVVQFVVIAKGAERVAEVAARFSLDAMPGKQMSIDSDLRAGLADKDDARRRRKLLELESKLNGSLDGAMKFVKGDAMAGIVIVLINLLGGLGVGVLQQGMSFDQAIQTYSVLTIGDGMVSQIPALLAAMAAGLIVTRTSSDTVDEHLGEAVQKQLTQKPRVLLMAGLLCFALALLPGFPHMVFLTFGFLGLASGVLLDAPLKRRLANSHPALRGWLGESGPQDGSPRTAAATAQPLLPLVLVIDGVAEQAPLWTDLACGVAATLSGFEQRVGVLLPEIHLQQGAADAPMAWRVLAYELMIGGGQAGPEGAEAVIVAGVNAALRRHLSVFLGVQEASALLQKATESHPEVVKEVMRSLTMTRIAEVLRLLVEEEVSLRNLHIVLERLADAGQAEKDGQALAALARIALCAHITAPYLEGGRLRALTLAPPLERQLREMLKTHNGGAVLAIEPAAGRELLDSIAQLVRQHGIRALVAPYDLRRPLRKFVAEELFDLPVLAYQEVKLPVRLNVLAHLPPLAEQDVSVAA